MASTEEIKSLFERFYGATPTEVAQPDVDGEFNRIYFVHFEDKNDAVFRVSVRAQSRVKTDNEIGSIKLVKAKTTIPVPDLLFSGELADGSNYICTSKISGEPLSRLWPELSEAEFNGVIDQVVGIYSELSKLKSDHPHGVAVSPDNDAIVPGPLLTYAMYDTAHIDEYWGGYGVTFETLNSIQTPKSVIDVHVQALNRDLYVLKTHRAVSHLAGAMAPKIERIVAALADPKGPLAVLIDPVPVHFAHRDLHLGNLLYDRTSGQITAVLDWELAGYFEADNWEPGNTLAPAYDPTGEGADKLQHWRQTLFEKAESVYPQQPNEESMHYKLRKFVSLGFWIIYMEITDGKPEARKQWKHDWDSMYEQVVGSTEIAA